MSPFEYQEKPDEIVIEKLTTDDDGNLKVTLLIPPTNRHAYKLFCETFFERTVRDAQIKVSGAPQKKEPA